MTVCTYPEEEAQTKWCPFVRFACDIDDTPSNRWDTDKGLERNPAPCRCIASACMAWRWSGKLTVNDLAQKRGYCGLAGYPYA